MRQGHPAPMPDQQLCSEFLLQLLHLMGDIGLADFQFARGAAEVPGSGDAVEISQLTQFKRAAGQPAQERSGGSRGGLLQRDFHEDQPSIARMPAGETKQG